MVSATQSPPPPPPPHAAPAPSPIPPPPRPVPPPRRSADSAASSASSSAWRAGGAGASEAERDWRVREAAGPDSGMHREKGIFQRSHREILHRSRLPVLPPQVEGSRHRRGDKNAVVKVRIEGERHVAPKRFGDHGLGAGRRRRAWRLSDHRLLHTELPPSRWGGVHSQNRRRGVLIAKAGKSGLVTWRQLRPDEEDAGQKI